jgi:mono/diheme cytochrome c family protein
MRLIAVGTILLFGLVTVQITDGEKKPRKLKSVGPGLQKAPEESKQWQNPFAGQENARLAGKKLYRRYCAECHGKEGKGQDEAPDLNVPVIQKAEPGQLFWFLRNGNLKEGMPAWSRLPDQQLWQLVTYLQTAK